MKKLCGFPKSKALLATLLSVTFMLCPRMMITSAGSSQEPLKLRSESQLRTEAGLYDTAIREINRVSTMRLDTVEDLKAANAILDKQFRNLKYNRSKLAVMGLNDSTFLGAVKERTRDSSSTNAFVNEFAQDPNSILKHRGATSLGDRIVRSVETDAALLRRVAELIKKASVDIKAKIVGHHVANKMTASTDLNKDGSLSMRRVGNATTQKDKGLDAVMLVGVVLLTFTVVGPILVTISVGASLVGRLIENLGTEEGRDRLAQCNDAAHAKYANCLAESQKLCCGLSVPAGGLCLAELGLKLAECLIS